MDESSNRKINENKLLVKNNAANQYINKYVTELNSKTNFEFEENNETK